MGLSERPPVLYAACAAPLADAELYAAAYAAASPRRRERTDRYRFERDRRLSLGAELLLRHGLREAGLERFPTSFDYGAQEKPYLKEGGVWFNLSHSEEWAVCAVADREVGCDVEKIRPVSLNIAKRFFRRSEYDEIAACPTPEERADLFFRCWTLKESFMKATGLGMKLPMDEFQVLRDGKISAVQSVDERHWRFWEFQEIDGYKCAVCAAGDTRPQLRILDLREILSRERTI